MQLHQYFIFCNLMNFKQIQIDIISTNTILNHILTIIFI